MADLTPIPGSRRGKAGRPRKGDMGIYGKPESGHNLGTPAAGNRANSGQNGSALASLTVAPVVPRLLDLHGAAAYLSLSEWTVRDLEGAGILSRVRVPLPNHGEVRKLLFDRVDLDRHIEQWKESAR
jgi:hypothetical protein